MKIVIKIFLSLHLISTLGGCSIAGGGNVLPVSEEMTTADIYKIVINDNNGNYSLAKRELDAIKVSYSKATRDSMKNINKQFQTLPNPQIPVYVFPHYVKAGDELVPVTGYTTAFHMYKQEQFAMLGERY